MILRADAAVIGAGPAGCSAAIYLAKQGRRVVLVDKARFPRPKPCGEGVMPSGLAVLDELGVLHDVERAGKHYRGIQFTGFNGRKAAGYFPGGRYGIAVPRETLDAILIQKAKFTPNIEVLESVCITKPLMENSRLSGWEAAAERFQGSLSSLTSSPITIHADHTLIADGANSAAARMLNLKRVYPSRKRLGMTAHFSQVSGLGDLVEVYFLPGSEIYVAPQGDDSALIAILLEETAARWFAGRTRQAFMETIRSCPELQRRMGRAIQASEIIGAGPLGGSAEKRHGPGWLLVGDSAESVDPITGEGISLALLSGKLAAQQLVSGARPAAYDRKRKRLARRKRLLARLLLQASRRPWLCDFLVGRLARSPSAFDYFLSDC